MTVGDVNQVATDLLMPAAAAAASVKCSCTFRKGYSRFHKTLRFTETDVAIWHKITTYVGNIFRFGERL